MARIEPTDSLPAMLRFLWGLLDTRRRWQAVGLQLLSLAMGVATLGGIAAVVPFFAVLGDPALIRRNATLAGFMACSHSRRTPRFSHSLACAL